MVFLLSLIGCALGPPTKAPLSAALCDAWKGKIELQGERIVLCTNDALTLRAEGKQALAKAEAWHEAFSKIYTLEQDVSRSRHFAKIYKGEGARVAVSVTENTDGTTISIRRLR